MPDDDAADSVPEVWIVLPGDLFGGAERQVLTLCEGHPAQFRVRLLPIFDGPFAQQARARGLAVTPLAGAAGSFADSVRTLRRMLAAQRPDVVHLHGYRASVTAALAAFAQRGTHPAFVKTVHGAQESRGVPFATRLRMLLNRTLERCADAYLGSNMIYVSHDLRRRMTGSSGGEVIHNGASTAVTSQAARPRQFASDRLNLLIIGRLDRVKNVTLAVSAMSRPEVSARAVLHILGDGPDAASLASAARAAGLDASIVFHGFIDDPAPFFAHADMLLLPSLHEGIPYVVLEAMQAEVAVIASDVGGIPEMVRHGESALLVDPRDAQTLATAIVTLADSVALRQTLTRNARERFRRQFAASVMVDAYAKVFHGLTETHPKL